MPPRKAAASKRAAAKKAPAKRSPATATKKPRGAVTKAHKSAMIAGRRDAIAVRNYLDALGTKSNGVGRGHRSVTKASLRARLGKVDKELTRATDSVARLVLTQTKLDTQAALAGRPGHAEGSDMATLTKEFKKVAQRFSEHKGITWTTWRTVGVPAAVLSAAGVPRTNTKS